MKTIQFAVSDSGPATLLAFLAAKLQTSKKKAKQLLDRRDVFVNRRRVWMGRHVLSTGDHVEVLTPMEPVAKRRPVAILHEDADFLVVAKPAGVPSTGAGSLVERLRGDLGLPELAAVHRLDRDTSGCVLLAKHRQAQNKGTEMFRRRQVAKTYQVIVEGRLEATDKQIAKPLEGRSAVTRVRTLDSNKSASHLSVVLETGRTHQIRKHLAASRHPVLGDRTYAGGPKNDSRLVKVRRQMLHASRLSFVHPRTGRRISVRAALPSDFRNSLRAFRLT